jgi:curved DNA-binding protein CbpA
LKSEIEQAFKIAARRVHPDAGGSNEAFQRLAAAKDVSISRWQH